MSSQDRRYTAEIAPGRQRRRVAICLQLALALLFLAASTAAQDAAEQLKTEIDQLQQALKPMPDSIAGFPDIKAQISKQLQSADRAARAGQLYLSLEQMAQVPDVLEGVREAAKSDTVKGNLPAFESEWGRLNSELTTLEQKAGQKNWENSEAAIRALAEIAEVKAVPLLNGGRGFATAVGPQAGLFNSGEGLGEAEFAQFCATLNLPRKAAPLPLRSMLPELEGLQEKTNAAFQPPRSIDLHSRFIDLNSTLKLAQELDAGGFYAGALYQYLMAVLEYGLLDAAPVTTTQQAELQPAIAAARKKLKTSGRDDSLVELSLELADSWIKHADGSTPTTDDWRSAEVILDQVLPAYFAALNPPVLPKRATAGRVEITLVRWPHT